MTTVERALAALDEDALVALALELTSIASPVGDNDELARVTRTRMQEAGLVARIQPFAPSQSNVLGTLTGSGGGRTLMFNTNTENDCSPEATSVPPARIVGGDRISAAGIWNMKGTLAAAIAAASAVRTAGVDVPGDVLIAGVAAMNDQAAVDTRLSGGGFRTRQGYGAGTKHMLVSGALADMAVVGTPTSFKLLLRHFGTIGIRVDLKLEPVPAGTMDDLTGDLGFWSRTSAIEYAAEVVEALRAWKSEYERRTAIEGVRASVRLAGIEGGLPWSPGSATDCTVFLWVGTAPGADLATVFAEVRAVVARVSAAHDDLRAHAELYSVNPGPEVTRDSAVATAVRAAHRDVFGEDPEEAVAIWHSDASPLATYGIPAVNYGPAGTLGPDREETVRIRDLVDCARVYTSLIVRVCGGEKA